MQINKPFLIIPKLIEQPTWGGNYIIQKKNWLKKPLFNSLKIGQSYELYGDSKLSSILTDSDDERFEPDLQYSSGKIKLSSVPSIPLKDFILSNPKNVLGPKYGNVHKDMPILIKFTQALGNSFQLHIRNDAISPQWQAKPESWYYFEKGKITGGIQKQCDISTYKTVCSLIDNKMKELSQFIQTKVKSFEDATHEAKEYIRKLNPWQFVNVYTVDKNTIVDLSSGGIHHSWEEDALTIPNGNILYEVQVDIPDEKSTVRCFDQGKFQKDGSIRKIHIDDYFSYLDTLEENNDPSHLIRKKINNTIFDTKYYTTDEIEITKHIADSTGDSFVHLFVRKGIVYIKTKTDTIRLTEGHSVFIPWIVKTYDLVTETTRSNILKTYIRS